MKNDNSFLIDIMMILQDIEALSDRLLILEQFQPSSMPNAWQYDLPFVREGNSAQVLETMRGRKGWYDPALLQPFSDVAARAASNSFSAAA